MIENATLLRVDPPAPADAGPVMIARCAVAAPTISQTTSFEHVGASAESVLYIRPTVLAPGISFVVDGFVTVQPDGFDAALWQIAAVKSQGGSLAHLEVWLNPVEA